jgi:hypothetical protein
MRTGIVNQKYTVIALNEHLEITKDYENETITVEIEQNKGEELEVWKEREDGFLFVYCNRMEIGYWVIPSHINLTD